MNRYIRITKLCSSPNPLYPMKDLNEYEHGQINPGYTLPSEYYVEGTITNPPVVGESFTMLRSNRNGVKISGIFTTSKVTKITDNGFETLNSVYLLEDIDN
jgi:hypothetical protein